MNSSVSIPAIALSTVLFTLAASTPAQSQPTQCDISGTWQYRSPNSLTMQNGQYRPAGNPYTTTVQLTESDVRQEKVSEGDRSQVVRIATLKASNMDPSVQERNARMVTSMRVGETAGILLAVPVAGVSFGGGLVLEGKISANCQTIQGQAAVGGAGEKFPFTLQRQGSQASNPSPSSTSAGLSGNWVTFLSNRGKLENFGAADRLTQTGNQLQLVSSISGQTFSGRISGKRVELRLTNGLNVGTLSDSGDRITFSDMVMVRLGSPTCPAINTCKAP